MEATPNLSGKAKYMCPKTSNIETTKNLLLGWSQVDIPTDAIEIVG